MIANGLHVDYPWWGIHRGTSVRGPEVAWLRADGHGAYLGCRSFVGPGAYWKVELYSRAVDALRRAARRRLGADVFSQLVGDREQELDEAGITAALRAIDEEVPMHEIDMVVAEVVALELAERNRHAA